MNSVLVLIIIRIDEEAIAIGENDAQLFNNNNNKDRKKERG